METFWPQATGITRCGCGGRPPSRRRTQRTPPRPTVGLGAEPHADRNEQSVDAWPPTRFLDLTPPLTNTAADTEECRHLGAGYSHILIQRRVRRRVRMARKRVAELKRKEFRA